MRMAAGPGVGLTAPPRVQVTPLAHQPPALIPNAVAPERSPTRSLWALFLARIDRFALPPCRPVKLVRFHQPEKQID
jgi:hypothetical protein